MQLKPRGSGRTTLQFSGKMFLASLLEMLHECMNNGHVPRARVSPNNFVSLSSLTLGSVDLEERDSLSNMRKQVTALISNGLGTFDLHYWMLY